MSRRRSTSFGRQLRLRAGLVAAFLLPVVVTAAVSLQALSREAGARRLMVEETYRSVANLVSTRLDERIAIRTEALIAEIGAGGWSEANLIQPQHRVRIARPFRLGALLVTNAQDAAFYPGKAFRPWEASRSAAGLRHG